jgi:hypothetical protein
MVPCLRSGLWSLPAAGYHPNPQRKQGTPPALLGPLLTQRVGMVSGLVLRLILSAHSRFDNRYVDFLHLHHSFKCSFCSGTVRALECVRQRDRLDNRRLKVVKPHGHRPAYRNIEQARGDAHAV